MVLIDMHLLSSLGTCRLTERQYADYVSRFHEERAPKMLDFYANGLSYPNYSVRETLNCLVQMADIKSSWIWWTPFQKLIWLMAVGNHSWMKYAYRKGHRFGRNIIKSDTAKFTEIGERRYHVWLLFVFRRFSSHSFKTNQSILTERGGDQYSELALDNGT